MISQKYLAEFLGTAILVIVGCGSVVVAGFGTQGAIGVLTIALAFGFIVIGLAYAIGPISGCHINPAVTICLWAAGKISVRDLPGYILSQFAGAAAGAGFLVLVLSGQGNGADIAATGLGQNGWGEGYLGNFSGMSAFTTEAFATFVLCLVVLATSRKDKATPFAGLAVGLSLTVLLVCFINVSGASLNPARSFGPAIFVGGKALAQLWLFFAAPILGGLIAALAARLLWPAEAKT